MLLRRYLEGVKLTIRPDHDSLKWILNLSGATSILARWRLSLSEFDFDTDHRTGGKNRATDGLSRLETQRKDIAHINDYIPVATIDLNEDKGETTKVLHYTVCHIRDQKDYKPPTMMPEVKALVQ